MIVIADKPGQLGNLLIVYAGFLTFAREHGLRLYNPAFRSYRHYFAGPAYSGAIAGYQAIHLFARVLGKLRVKNSFLASQAIDWNEVQDLDDPIWRTKLPKLLFVRGWKYRGNNLLSKHQEYIRNCFMPAPPYAATLDAWWNKTFGNRQELTIGIHIRRGDYRNFENGRYYYEPQAYAERMRQLEHFFSDRTIHFLICSNETLDAGCFASLRSRVSFGPGHELLDLYSLSRCHYITGPPSTYTMWASFHGRVPLDMLHDLSQPVTLERFKIQETF